MDLKLAGLNVVITGGSSGIGAAIVQEFLNEGCNVSFCSRSDTKINERIATLSNPLQGKISGKVLDISNLEEFSSWLQEVGQVDIFIPNVSALSFNNTYLPNENNLSANWEAVINVDLNCTIKQIDLVVPYLLQSDYGAITYIGSIAGSRATPGMPAYGATKAALTHYMKTLSKKLLAKNIRVNTVSPGDIFVPNGFWDEIRQNRPQSYQEAVARNPTGRLGIPEEIAKVVAFISSPVASFVAGANWLADGGASNHPQL